MPLMFTLHIFQTYLIQHLQLLLRRTQLCSSTKKITSFKPKLKKMEKLLASSQTFPPSSPSSPPQKKQPSKPVFHLVIPEPQKKNKVNTAALLRRETVARCELDGFAHGQVAGSLLQGYVFEMTLVSWFWWATYHSYWKNIKSTTKNKCDLEMDV